MQDCPMMPLLQFGHDFSAVETWKKANPGYGITVLQFGHDFSAVETLAPGVLAFLGGASFNSATTFQPWKPVFKGAIICPITRFNSATTFQPWKLLLAIGQ